MELMKDISQAVSTQHNGVQPNGVNRLVSWVFGKTDEKQIEELIRSTQSLYDYVHRYFTITNRLVEILNTQMGEDIFLAVPANESESIEQNCARVRNTMCQILNVCEQKDKHVSKSIEPALYDKIAISVVSLKVKATVIKDLHDKTMGLLGNVLCPLVTVQLARSDLGNVMPPVEQLKIQPVSSFVLGDLVQSSKIIMKLLCEQEQQQKTLDEAVQLVKDLLWILKPSCDAYNNLLCRVEAYMTIITENI